MLFLCYCKNISGVTSVLSALANKNVWVFKILNEREASDGLLKKINFFFSLDSYATEKCVIKQ